MLYVNKIHLLFNSYFMFVNWLINSLLKRLAMTFDSLASINNDIVYI